MTWIMNGNITERDSRIPSSRAVESVRKRRARPAPAEDGSGMAVNRLAGADGRGPDGPREKAVGAFLDLDLIEPGPAEEALQRPRGWQEVAAQGNGPLAMDSVDESAASGVRDPEHPSRPQGLGEAA